MRFVLLVTLLILSGTKGLAQMSIPNGDDHMIVNPGAPLRNDKYVQRFRQAVIRAIEKAQNAGMKEVQGIKLAEIKKAAQNVNIGYSARFKYRQNNRLCAYWNKEARGAIDVMTGKKSDVPAQILIYDDCESLSDKELEPIALHEVLGLVFDTDFKYEISTQILSYESLTPTKSELMDHKYLNIRLQDLKSSGGSTGVGGGGDFHDLRFKLEGLKFLLAQKQAKVFGVPKEILRIAIQQMKVRPASDITKNILFRGPGIESEAIAYILSPIYRSQDTESLGFLAAFTARLFVIYAPYEIGLVEEKVPLMLTLRDSKVVQDPCFFIPAPEVNFKYIQWRNPDLRFDSAQCVDPMIEAVEIANSPLGSFLKKSLEELSVVEVKPTEF